MTRVLHRIPPIAPDKSQLSAAGLSFRRVFEALEASGAARELVADGFPGLVQRGAVDDCELIVEGVEGFFVHSIDPAAGGAGEFISRIEPSEQYGEFVRAVADEGDLQIVPSHGWPILSFGPGSPNVTEAGRESILPGGGPDA